MNRFRIPVVLFAYSREDTLARVLQCLKRDGVPRILAFSDGPRGGADEARVAGVRALLDRVDWCDIDHIRRPANLGLGRNVLAGVTSVAETHPAFIVWEDDLVCVPGTYAWMCTALERYADDPRVMSVSGWNHPLVTPSGIDRPYFDRRAECWVWGAYARSWTGMEVPAREKMVRAEKRGTARDAFGSDLPVQAAREQERNTWAVRWIYHHLERGGLCLRPPRSLVEHIGWGDSASNAGAALRWSNPDLPACAPSTPCWPEPGAAPDTADRWKAANPPRRLTGRIAAWAARRVLPRVPVRMKVAVRGVVGHRWFRGDFQNWEAAARETTGYDTEEVVTRTLSATRAVIEGRAAFERDGCRFFVREPDRTLLRALGRVSTPTGGPPAVVDVGGGLGSSFWRNRPELHALGIDRWSVVELPRMVRAGREGLDSAEVEFFSSLEEAQQRRLHDVLVCATTLQYVQDADSLLTRILEGAWGHVLLLNLPLIRGGRDRILVQTPPADVQRASYPVRFFAKAPFLRRLEARREVVEVFPSEAVWPFGILGLQSTGVLLGGRRS